MSAQTSQATPIPENDHYHHREHHVIPLKTYYGVYGALLVLTVATVGVSYANLGPASLFVAMAVAVVKAALVAGYFMHLKYDERFNSFVFFSSLLFLAIMFVLTLADLGTRGMIDPNLDNFALKRDRAAQERMDATAAAEAAAKAAAMPGATEGGAAAPGAPADGAAADKAPDGAAAPARTPAAAEMAAPAAPAAPTPAAPAVEAAPPEAKPEPELKQQQAAPGTVGGDSSGNGPLEPGEAGAATPALAAPVQGGLGMRGIGAGGGGGGGTATGLGAGPTELAPTPSPNP